MSAVPLCPKALRAHWVTDDHGELVLSCTPSTPDDLEHDAAERKYFLIVVSTVFIVWAILLCLITYAKKWEHDRAGRHKKIANAYPGLLFPPRNI